MRAKESSPFNDLSYRDKLSASLGCHQREFEYADVPSFAFAVLPVSICGGDIKTHDRWGEL
jgi:hypothetical protein